MTAENLGCQHFTERRGPSLRSIHCSLIKYNRFNPHNSTVYYHMQQQPPTLRTGCSELPAASHRLWKHEGGKLPFAFECQAYASTVFGYKDDSSNSSKQRWSGLGLSAIKTLWRRLNYSKSRDQKESCTKPPGEKSCCARYEILTRNNNAHWNCINYNKINAKQFKCWTICKNKIKISVTSHALQWLSLTQSRRFVTFGVV